MSKKLVLEFGTPEHRWLPVNFRSGDFELVDYISDVPVDPIEQLLDTLIQISKGIREPDSILWHLEPYCYYVHLEHMNQLFKLYIFESKNLNSPLKKSFEIEGDYDQIIIPLYNGLKKFCSRSLDESHWKNPDLVRIKELDKLINARTENE